MSTATSTPTTSRTSLIRAASPPDHHMAKLVGYGTFLVEHLIFGLYLGPALVIGVKRAR